MQTQIQLGYDLPFAARVTAAPPGDPLRVAAEVAGTATDEDLRRIEAHVQVWVEGALFGASGGPQVPPTLFNGPLDVEQVLKVRDHVPSADAVTCEAPSIACEPAYAAVLLHKLYCLGHHFAPLKTVSILLPTVTRAQRPIDLVRAEESDLPGLASLDFHWDDESDSGADSVELNVRFVAQPPDGERQLLVKMLWSWLTQGLQGGYISPPHHPENFSLLASDDPTIANGELSWIIDDVLVDPRAFNLLANTLQAFARRFTRIIEASVQ